MTQEEKYKEALLEARAVLEPCLKYSNGKVREALDSIDNELKRFESEDEDERTRKKLIEYHKQQFENNRDQEVGLFHKDAIAWLEKQKEKSEIPIMGGDTDTYFDDLRMTTKPLTSREWFDEGIKYAQKLQKEQKPKAKAKSPLSPHELYDAKIEGISQGRQDVLDHPEQFGLQKPAEWSEEDEKKLERVDDLLWILDDYFGDDCSICEERTARLRDEIHKELCPWLKSLRPQYHGDVTMTEAYKMGLEAGKASSWKPSEEQMNKLKEVIYGLCTCGNGPVLKSLYEDLKKLI